MEEVNDLWQCYVLEPAKLNFGWHAGTYEGDRKLFVATIVITHNAVFWFLAMLLYIINHFNLFSRYRIQPGKFPTRQLVIKCIREVIIGHLIEIPVMYAIFPVFAYFGTTATLPLPSVTTILWQLAVFALTNETIFYWTHRLVHWPPLYAIIHKQHHEFKDGAGINSEYGQVFDALLMKDIPSITACILTGAHVFTIGLWMALHTWEDVDSHSGFAFPFTPWSLNEDALHHDFHHSHNIGNYSSHLQIWDRLLGTDQEYRKWYAARKLSELKAN